jgi:hypothetical protein
MVVFTTATVFLCEKKKTLERIPNTQSQNMHTNVINSYTIALEYIK